MLVVLKEGRRAGETVDMPAHVAKVLLEAGRADDPFSESDEPEQAKPESGRRRKRV